MADLKAFTMPKWGIEMAEGHVAGWMVKEGEPFAKGTVLTLIETDKIANDVEAEADGRLARIVAEAGETYPVGALLAVLGDGDAAEVDAFVAGFQPSGGGVADVDEDTGRLVSPGADPAANPDLEPPPVPPAVEISDAVRISPAARARAAEAGIDVAGLKGSGRGERITAQDVDQASRPEAPATLRGPYPPIPPGPAFAAPAARRLAARHGVDLGGLTGTGPRGRISKMDVLAAVRPPEPAPPEPLLQPVQAAPAAAALGVEVVKMTPMRKAIARRLTQSKQTIPHFYVRRRVRADRLLALRGAIAAPRPSINDYLVRASALALMEVPAVNIQVHDEEVHRFDRADIAVAVATEKGLVTPIVSGADLLLPAEIATRMGALAQRARAGKLRPAEFSGGSFSISNLGPFGVEQFDAIINPPQGAILAVGAARPEPIDDAGAIRIVPVLHLSLSCDHRAIDGADGARFLAALAELIEHPERLL